jgi:hypothetical protein
MFQSWARIYDLTMNNFMHLTGTGHLYEGPKKICMARYRIELERIMNFGASDPDERISGIVEPIDAALAELFGRRLTLLFEDARKLDFYINDVGFVVSCAPIY